MSQYWEIQTRQEDNTDNTGNATTDGYGQISILLNNYVRKEKGKGLSTNDFTNEYKNKLESCEVGSQKNKLEYLKINNSIILYPTEEKFINLNLPTKMSDLENDVGFAKNINNSQYTDYRDSYVGKSKLAYQDESDINIGKNSVAINDSISIGENAISNIEGGIAIGKNTQTDSSYDINIGNKLKHNSDNDIWEGTISNSEYANTAILNENGTSLNLLDNTIDDLNNEINTRINDVSNLQSDINTEIRTRSDADTVLNNKITNIEDLIPNQASTSNQLADKSFVNSSIQTSTANFRGSWSTWADVPTVATDYPVDFSGNKTPTTNDYLVVQDASDYTLESLVGTWRFKYIGNWSTDGKNGWLPEYQVNEEPFTSDQLYAINSGITEDKVTSYDNHLSNTSNPHNVTASQVGLGNVNNTADCEKTVKNSECFNGCTYACAKEDILSGNASTSTKLSTCHKINGTDFDGSADITTSYWGTARNIGIINNDGTGSATTVSVNGCENVNLKLPSTIKASLDGTSCCSCCVYTECVNDDNTYYLTLSDSNTNGQKDIYTNTNLSYNPFTGVLCATCFCGNVASSGDVSMCDIGACDSDIPIILCTGTTCVGRSTNINSNLTFNSCRGLLCTNCVHTNIIETPNITICNFTIETKKPTTPDMSCDFDINTAWTNSVGCCYYSNFHFCAKCNSFHTSNINIDRCICSNRSNVESRSNAYTCLYIIGYHTNSQCCVNSNCMEFSNGNLSVVGSAFGGGCISANRFNVRCGISIISNGLLSQNISCTQNNHSDIYFTVCCTNNNCAISCKQWHFCGSDGWLYSNYGINVDNIQTYCIRSFPTNNSPNQIRDLKFTTYCSNGSGTMTTFTTTCICGCNGWLYNNCGICACCVYAPNMQVHDICAWYIGVCPSQISNITLKVCCTNSSCVETTKTITFCGSNGYMYGNVCGNICGTACKAGTISSHTLCI